MSFGFEFLLKERFFRGSRYIDGVEALKIFLQVFTEFVCVLFKSNLFVFLRDRSIFLAQLIAGRVGTCIYQIIFKIDCFRLKTFQKQIQKTFS